MLPPDMDHARYRAHLELSMAAVEHDAGDRAAAQARAAAAVNGLPAEQRSDSILAFVETLRLRDRPRRPIVVKRMR